MLKALLPCKIDYDGEYHVETEEVDIEKAKKILTNIRDKEGNTLLYHAAKYGYSRNMLNFLVENGVDINAKNKNRAAPIHITAKYGHQHLHATPISIAASNNHKNTTGKLLSRGAKPNIMDNRGWTPIQIAISVACDESRTEEEREKAYSIIEKLSLFSHLPKKAVTNERVKKILEKALSSRGSDNTPSAPVNEYEPSVDDDFYDKVGSFVKDIPQLCLYPDLSEILEDLVRAKEESTAIINNSEKPVTEQKTNVRKASNELQKIAKSPAIQGKLLNLEIDDATFYLEYSPDSVVDVAKIVDGARGLGLYQGSIEFGCNIVKIGESAVEIETNKGIRNYADLSDNGDIIITFQTSLSKLDVRLYNSVQYKDFIQLEVCNPERFNQLKEEIGKNCLLVELTLCGAIEQGYFMRYGALQSSETISFISQAAKEETKEIMENIDSRRIKSIKEEKSWQSKIKEKRINGSYSRGM